MSSSGSMAAELLVSSVCFMKRMVLYGRISPATVTMLIPACARHLLRHYSTDFGRVMMVHNLFWGLHCTPEENRPAFPFKPSASNCENALEALLHTHIASLRSVSKVLRRDWADDASVASGKPDARGRQFLLSKVVTRVHSTQCLTSDKYFCKTSTPLVSL